MLGTPVKCYAVVPDADNRRLWAMAILEVRTLYGHWNVRELDHVNTYNPWLNSSATNVRHWSPSLCVLGWIDPVSAQFASFGRLKPKAIVCIKARHRILAPFLGGIKANVGIVFAYVVTERL